PNVKSININSFKDCTKLETVSITSVESIDVKAFKNCENLTQVNMTNVSEIGLSAFINCTSLTQVDMTNVSEVGVSAFENCQSLTQINMPNVKSININSFKDCTKLETVSIISVESIGEKAFENCKSLTQVNMTNVSEIGASAFENCKSLTQVNLPNVKSININSFKDCTKLETVYIPSVESIGDNAFENCTKLSVLELPENNIEISYTAFSGSKQEKIVTQKFKSEKFTAYTPNGEIQFSTDGKTVFMEKYTGNDKSIDSSMISKALGITSYEQIEIGDSCFAGTDVEKANLIGFAKVGIRAFAGCKKLNELRCNAYLDDYAFEGCVNLKSVDIVPLPSDVNAYDLETSYTTSIGKGCFKDSGIENINDLFFSAVDYHINQNAFEGTPIEAAANEKIYNRTAMMIYPEKYIDCDFEFRVSLVNVLFDYDDVLYAQIISDEAESGYDIIALEKTSEFENISANAVGELDIVCTFTGENAFKFEYQGFHGDSVIPLFTIKEIKNPEAIGGNNDSSYLKLSDISMEELLSPGFEDKYYGVGFTFDIHVFTAEGGMAGIFTGLDMMSGYNVRTMAFYPDGSDVGKVYRMYGKFYGFYTDEEGYTYLNFELDDYDYKNVTDEYF
ncbi:MAG: leucine-rich repeat protein, partial [Oscillospiraceae bacterium]